MIAYDIREWLVPKFSWHLSYSWGKTPENTSTRRTNPIGDRTRTRWVRGNDVTPWLQWWSFTFVAKSASAGDVNHGIRTEVPLSLFLFYNRLETVAYLEFDSRGVRPLPHVLRHGCARVAHYVSARWRNFSHYCRPLRHCDVWFTWSEHREALPGAHTTHGVHRQEFTLQGGST